MVRATVAPRKRTLHKLPNPNWCALGQRWLPDRLGEPAAAALSDYRTMPMQKVEAPTQGVKQPGLKADGGVVVKSVDNNVPSIISQ